MYLHLKQGPIEKESHAAVNGDASYDKLAENFGEVALAIKRFSKDQLIISDLYEEVMKMEGYDRIMIAFAFDYLADNERAIVMTKNVNLQNLWVENSNKSNGRRKSEFMVQICAKT